MKKQTSQPKTHRTPPLSQPLPHDRATDGPMSPYAPTWDPQEQALFALGSIAVVEDLLSCGGPKGEASTDGAAYLLWWAREFLEALHLETNAEECYKRAAWQAEQNRKHAAPAKKES